MNDDADDRRNAALTFQDQPADDPDVSPALADLSPLPPTHVEVGSVEVLLGEGRIFVERSRAAGAEASIHVEPDAFHMWQLWAPWLPEANASLDRAAAFLQRRLGL
jgi:acetyl esterase/lipase